MQRNFTPQGRPQDPGALDRQMHEVALKDLQALTPLLASRTLALTELQALVAAAVLGRVHTTAELSSMARQTRLALGIR